jgi:hypothetical protein
VTPIGTKTSYLVSVGISNRDKRCSSAPHQSLNYWIWD